MGTPASLTLTTTNGVTTTSHTHAVIGTKGTVTGNVTSWTSTTFAALTAVPRIVVTPNTSNVSTIAGKIGNVSTTGFEIIIGGSGIANTTFDYIALV